MITSIIQLPEFARPDTVIDGVTYGGIYPSNIIDNIRNAQISGRKFPVLDGLLKYKLRVIDMYGKMCDIVVATLSPLNLYDYASSANVEIFPLYLRESPCAGYSSHFLSSVILNVAAINRLFQYLGLPNVCTVQYAIKYAVSKLTNEISHIPDWILDNKSNAQLATLAPLDTTLMEYVIGGGESAAIRLRDVVNRSCVPDGILGTEVSIILNSTHFLQISDLIDPAHQLSLIEMSYREASVQFPDYGSIIHSCEPPWGDHYKEKDNGSMSYLLYNCSLLKTQDYTVDLQPSGSLEGMHANGFDINYDVSNFRFDNYNILQALNSSIRAESSAFSEDYFQGMKLSVTASYLEDLWIYDSSDNLMTYIDLVWWILAAGAGLINISSVCID